MFLYHKLEVPSSGRVTKTNVFVFGQTPRSTNIPLAIYDHYGIKKVI